MTKIRFTRRTAEDRAKQQGPEGEKGDRGPKGEDGEDGASAYEIWLSEGNTGSEADFLKKLRGPRGRKGERGPTGGGGQGPQGEIGPAGPAGGEGPPLSATLTRDENGGVASVTTEGEATWVIQRNPDGSVAGLSNGVSDVTVDRDVDDAVSGITVTDA